MKVLRKFISVIALMGIGVGAMVGCSGGSTQMSSDVTTNQASSSTADKKEEVAQSDEKVVLKFHFFKGGYGDSWFKWLEEEYEKRNPNVDIQLKGTPDFNDTLAQALEFGGGETPDVFITNLGNQLEWGLKGLILEISDLYEKTVPGTEMTLNEYVTDSVPASYYFDNGETIQKFAIPWTSGTGGLIYNKNMFDEHGWKEPQTWEEFEKLCEEIKAAGIAPLTYPGLYVGYVGSLIQPMMYQYLGEDKFAALMSGQELEPWKDESFKKGYTEFENLFKKGWIMSGTQALDHTQSQMEFLNGKSAMIINGDWIENEMKEAIPEGFEMAMMPIPACGTSSQRTIQSGAGGIGAISAKTKNPDIAKDFLMFTCSPEASVKFTELCKGMRPYKYEVPNDLEVTNFNKSWMDILQDDSVKKMGWASINPTVTEMDKLMLGEDVLSKIASGELTAQQAWDNNMKVVEDTFNRVKQ